MHKLFSSILNFFWPKSSLRDLPEPPRRADAYAPTIANNPPEEMITKEEILMSRIAESDLPTDMQANLEKLHKSINKLRTAYGKPMIVSSGYRSPSQNAAAGGAKRSNHMSCLAVDIHDVDGQLDAWCLSNLEVLEKCGLWLEHPDATPRWCHLQVVPPKSGNRVFRP